MMDHCEVKKGTAGKARIELADPACCMRMQFSRAGFLP